MTKSSRRQFLQASAAIAAAASLRIPQLSAAEESKPKHRILIADKGNKIGSNYEEIKAKLKKYQDLGFDGLEGDAPGMNIEGVNKAVAELNFPVHGVVCAGHWQNRLSSPDPAIREIGRKSLEGALRESKALGGTSVLLVPGRVSGPDETHEDVWKRSIVEIRKALPVAEEQQIPILIENVWNGFCETPESMRDYIDEIDSPWVGVYFDIGNVRKFGKPEDWIQLLGKRIVKLDVKDWGEKNGFCRLGEGDVDWPAVCGALRDIDYKGWATREGGEDKSLEDTVELMNRLLER